VNTVGEAESFWPVFSLLQWEDVFKALGSCHSTLLGAFVLAWNHSAKERSALESGCSPTKGRVGANYCDAILCEGNCANPTPVGILEVEGNPFPSHKLKSGERAPTIFERMGRYWLPDGEKSRYFRHFGNLSFAVLVVYRAGAEDERYNKTKERLLLEGRRFLERVRDARSDFRVFVVIVRKCEGSAKEGMRSNPYYAGIISGVEWFEVTRASDQAGARIGRKTNPLVVTA
jgi:hypothetical protein